MNWLVNNWYYIALALVIICGAVIYVINFVRLPKSKRYELIQGWLLQAVLLAEREFGSNTGKLKLSFVYDKFCERFPWLVKVIPFALFSAYVDDALTLMRELIANNKSIASVVESSDGHE